MKRYLLFLFLPFLIVSCKNNSETEHPETEIASHNFEKLEQLQWLLGSWVNEFTPEFSKESWIKENDSTFSAYSFTTVNQDTVFAERMVIQQKKENVLMTVAQAPNYENPVIFRLISSENGEFVFENKNHDFPQRIVYTNPVKDSLHAWIEGPLEGEME